MLTISDNKLLHLQVAEHFREMIRRGRLQPGDRLPPVREVARRMGASVTPVNTAFRILAEEGLIYQRRGSGSFVKRRAAPPEVIEIGLVFRTPQGWRADDNFLLRLFTGMQDTLQEAQCRTTLSTFHRKVGPPTDVPRVFRDALPHGFLLDERTSDELAARAAATGRPVVVVERESEVPEVGSVFCDVEAAGAETARRMLERGHRAAGVVGHPNHHEPRAMAAFRRVLAEAGVPTPDSHALTYSTQDDGRPVFARLMSAHPTPTAVYCASDRVARQFCHWAEETGLRIPDDVSVVGCADMEMAAKLDPPLTTFRFVPEEVGQAAAEELIARCRDPERPPRVRRIEGQWIERRSLAPVRGE